MFIIQQVTNAPLQQMTLILEDGSQLSLTLYFMPMQQCWIIQNLAYGNFVLNGMRIVVSPNMLNQFINQLPFGLACFTNTGREPSLALDFSSGNFQLYILSQAECVQYAELLSLGPVG